MTLRDERHLKPTAGKLTHVWVLVVCIRFKYVSKNHKKIREVCITIPPEKQRGVCF